MPEHSPKPFAEELVSDEQRSGIPLAPQQVGFSAIEAGDEGRARQGQAPRLRCVGLDRGSSRSSSARRSSRPILPIPDPNNDVFPGLNRAGPSPRPPVRRRRQRPRRALPGHLGRPQLAGDRRRSRSSSASSSAGILGLIAGYFRGKVGTVLGSRHRRAARLPAAGPRPRPITTNLGAHALLRARSPWRSCRSRCWPASRAPRPSAGPSASSCSPRRAQGAKHGRMMIREVLPEHPAGDVLDRAARHRGRDRRRGGPRHPRRRA